MAAPAWATNLTPFYLEGATTVTALGGGPAALGNPETDFFIQGAECQSKGAWTNAVRGFIVDALGTTFTVPTSGAIVMWAKYDAQGSLDTQAGGGLRMLSGSGNGDFEAYFCAGSDTIEFNSWVPYVIDPNTATSDATTGTPGGAERWVGVLADLPTAAGPSKGNPIAIDAIRFGRCEVEYTLGDSADPSTFAGAEGAGNVNSTRWGLIELQQGAFQIQGFHSFGVSGTAVDFRDSNKVLFWRKQLNNLTDDAISVAFNRMEVINASTNVDWTNIIIQALGTRSPGTFVHTAGTWDCVLCQFVDVGTFSLLSTSVFTECTFRNTGIITAPGSNLAGSLVAGFEGAANTSPVIWDVATDPSANMNGMTFEMGTTLTHAIEFGLTSPLTMTLTDCIFTGYHQTTDNVNDSTFHIKRTTGTVTINISGTGTAAADLTARTDGATVVIVGSVNLKVTVKDVLGVAIQNAQTAIFDSSDTQLMNEDTTAGGIAEEGYAGSTPEDVTVRVRKGSTGATKYLPVASPQTITSSGLDVTITLIEDTTNAS